jgi:hypothetical protein
MTGKFAELAGTLAGNGSLKVMFAPTVQITLARI